MNKAFWKATGIRCLRTFLSTIMGVWTGGQLITEIDWKFTLISALSTTIYIFFACILAGIPEVPIPHEMTDEEANRMIEENEEILEDLSEYEEDGFEEEVEEEDE